MEGTATILIFVGIEPNSDAMEIKLIKGQAAIEAEEGDHQVEDQERYATPAWTSAACQLFSETRQHS